MKKRSKVKHEEVGNIEKNMFVIFGISKTKWKDKENPWLLTINDSTSMLTS